MNYRQDHPAWIYVRCASVNATTAFDRLYDLIDEAAGHGFLKLNASHIEYVLDRMRENTTYVRNIKKYLLAALYNAPVTMDSYYTSLVSHDLYGSGDRR